MHTLAARRASRSQRVHLYPKPASGRATVCHTHASPSRQVRPSNYDARFRWSRFLEVDPVEGGSANDYDYVNGDPINDFDLDGMWPKFKCKWCRKALKVAAIAGGIAGAVACGASVVCGVGVGIAAGAVSYAASNAGTRSFRWTGLAREAAIGGVLGRLTARGYLGGGNELKIGKFRMGSGKWQGGKGRPWFTRVPHYHRGATNKLRKLHRPWQGF